MISFILAVALSSAVDTPEPDWAELARGDINAMHAATLENHPGPIDPENPDFLTTMENARTLGLALADRAVDQAGFFYALQAYAVSYRDGHYQTGPGLQSAATAWPGFVAGRQGGVWRVRVADEAHAGLDGAVIESCDGRSLDEMALDNVFGFAGDPELNAQWVRFGGRLFLDSSNPFITVPQTCVFVMGDQRTEQDLDWQAIARSDWSAWVAMTRSRAEAGVTEFAPDSYWVGLPNFNPTDDELAGVQNLIADLAARADTLREARVLVLDVRGNGGGSSAWGDAIIDAIWGRDYAAWRHPADADGVDFRISDENIDHVHALIEHVMAQGHAGSEAELRAVYDGMLEARDAGQGYYREPAPARPSVPPAPNPVSARVFFLTDFSCASACLDFADEMLALEGVTQIGSETLADTNYMETRIHDLPSGYAGLALPIKVYRGRPRASGQSYVPEIAYTGLDGSTAAMQAWVNELVESGQ